MVAVTGCGPGPGPDFAGLELRMAYDTVAAIAGGPCEHIHDRGVRVLEWHYLDGSIVEATIHNGGLSGLRTIDSAAALDWTIAQGKTDGTGLQGDMPEAALRSKLGDDAATTHDTSDRECLWTYGDGSLTAIFMRGKLEQAVWQGEEAGDPEVLVTVTDPVAMLLADLRSEHSWDRARALQQLEDVDDPRVNDALLDLLRIEADSYRRGLAAELLAERNDRRAVALLLPDLQQERIPEPIIRALGTLGDPSTDAALARAEGRVGSRYTRARIQGARAQIQQRHGYTPPDASLP